VTQTGSYTSTNPSAGNQAIVITGAAGVTGSFAVDVVDDDQVAVTASVDPSLTFDLDAGTTAGANTGTPYIIALGTITAANGKVTGSTDGVNFIGVDLATNASSGAAVTVTSLNGANGLVSTATSADKIPSATATMANGTANYGICVISATQSGGPPNLTKVAPFASTCAADSETNSVGGLTTAAQNILTVSGPISAGRAEIAVNAAISGVTPAHSDYGDTLTFIATGTF
jgi:hypothetical protein